MPAKENGKTESITIRVTPEQKRKIKEYCDYQIENFTYSDFFESLILQFLEECKEDYGSKWKRHNYPFWWDPKWRELHPDLVVDKTYNPEE